MTADRREGVRRRGTRPRSRQSGFATPELLSRIAGLAVVFAVCMPILARMREGRMSAGWGVAVIAGVCLLYVLHRLRSRRTNRRRLTTSHRGERTGGGPEGRSIGGP